VPLLKCGVTRELDSLHAVEQRWRNSVERVCGGDEEDLGEVDGYVDIVVCESVVLLRIEYLKHGCAGVAIVV